MTCPGLLLYGIIQIPSSMPYLLVRLQHAGPQKLVSWQLLLVSARTYQAGIMEKGRSMLVATHQFHLSLAFLCSEMAPNS